MKSGTLLVLVAWQLVLTESIREIESFSADTDALSNIQLLIPLLVSDTSAQSELDERGREARPDDDMPFGLIPADAFTLDEDIATPRSLYLESAESSAEDRGELWRACKRMARAHAGAAHDVLLYLCAELLDVAGLPRASLPPCECCRHDADSDPPWFGPIRGRRDLISIGEDAGTVKRYLHMRRKTTPPPWVWEN